MGDGSFVGDPGDQLPECRVRPSLSPSTTRVDKRPRAHLNAVLGVVNYLRDPATPDSQVEEGELTLAQRFWQASVQLARMYAICSSHRDLIRSTEELIAEVAAQHREFARALAEQKSPLLPAENPGHADPGPAFPAWTGEVKGAIVPPPKPRIEPSARILERATGRDLDREAADCRG